MDLDERNKIYSLFEKWEKAIDVKEQKAIFYNIIENCGIERLVSFLRDYYNGIEKILIDNIIKMDCLHNGNSREIRTIAIFYYKMRNGGVERVISLLIPLFIDLGYKCILITDENKHEDDYEIPLTVNRYIIDSTSDIVTNRVAYFERAKQLADILKRESVDVVCYQAASSPILLYDFLLVKLYGIRFLLSQHELFSHCMVLGNDNLLLQMAIFPMLDKLIVLSRVENTFWRTMETDSIYIPNPYDINIQDCNEISGKSIVWVGRIDRYQKQYQEIIPIMKNVVQKLPNAVLKVYGGASRYDSIQHLEKLIRQNHLEKNIIYCGYETSVKEIYKDAKIHLVTSAYESFSMNIFESKMFGIPLVTYDMPYLELLKDHKGYIAVEQGDYAGAADAIVELLMNDKLINKLKKESIESIKKFDNQLVADRWETVFKNMNVDEKINNSDYPIILKTMAYHYSLGCKRINQEIKKLRDEKWISEIKLKLYREKLLLALYPFGTIGKNIKNLLEKSEILVDLIVDNNLAKENKKVISIDDLKNYPCKDYLFVICSDRLDIYDELRNSLKRFVDVENIYDLYPREC